MNMDWFARQLAPWLAWMGRKEAERERARERRIMMHELQEGA